MAFDASLLTSLTHPSAHETSAKGTLDWRRLCVDITASRVTMVGRGTFGTVVKSWTPGRCVKIERIIGCDPLDACAASLSVAERMGSIGVGPNVYAWRVIQCQCDATDHSDQTILVIEMDIVPGTTLHEWRLARRYIHTDSSKDGEMGVLVDALVAKVKMMNGLGVRHNDLNVHNVMVDKANVPWLIDYTFATQHRIGDAGDESTVMLANCFHGGRLGGRVVK